MNLEGSPAVNAKERNRGHMGKDRTAQRRQNVGQPMSDRRLGSGLAGLFVTLAVLCSSVAWGQGFAGIYLGNSEAGTVTVELSLVGEELAGRLSAQEVEFALEGFVQDGVGVGFAHTASGSLGFEAYLEGNTLGLYLFEMDSSGAPIVESVVELLLTRRAEAVAAAGSSTPASPPPAGTSSSQANPSSQPADQVLATGAYATLTYGNAEAFIEALEFVLAQLGYVYDFTEAERAEGLRSIAANYPAMNQMDQVVLSQARDILDRVKVNWPNASQAEQEEFALGVLILAFGEETVSAWVGSGSTANQGVGAGSGCDSFEECASSFVDEQTWTDTFNSQGCWAAAGCGGYDPSTSTFDYDTY